MLVKFVPGPALLSSSKFSAMTLLQNFGLVKTAQGKAVLTQIPVPHLRDDYMIIETKAVALNPTDWQNLDEPFKPMQKATLMGCDAAGIVVEVGKCVTKAFKKGDRVACMAHGGNVFHGEDGAFANFIAVKGDITVHIPDSLSFEEAAALPCGIATTGLAMYRDLDLPLLTLPIEEKITGKGKALLIYGGSSASGTIAVQFAKLSGLTVIATASPHNFSILTKLGADHVLDYRDPLCGQKINELTSNTLTQVYDTIATPSSANVCAEALSSSPGGVYVNLMGIDFPREDVKKLFPLGYTVTGEEFEMEGEYWAPVPEDFEFAKRFISLAEELLKEKLIRSHPVELRGGGLGGILDGLADMKKGKVSGKKLVYRVTDAQ